MYPGYPNTRVFLHHFSPRYPEVNTRVVRVVDYWPNLPFFTFLTKKSKILCDNSFTHDFFHRVIIKFRIKIVQKLCHFEIINPQLQFFDKNIQNLKNFKVINEYSCTYISNWVYNHYLGSLFSNSVTGYKIFIFNVFLVKGHFCWVEK